MAQATQAALAACAHLTPSGPPIWQGTARHGDHAEVLSRNPNGTFQVRIRGQEQTRTERDVAYMTGMNKPALDAHLDGATQSQLARGQAPSGPPIWQGTARHGDYAEVLSRNPNGTFQVRIRGQEQTRTERDVAYMTGMNKPALDAHLEGVMAGRQGGAFEAPPDSGNSSKGNDGALESMTPRQVSPLHPHTQNLPANKNPLPVGINLPQSLNDLRSSLQPMKNEARQLMNESRSLKNKIGEIDSKLGDSKLSVAESNKLEIVQKDLQKQLDNLITRRLELAEATRLLVSIPPSNRGQVKWRQKLVLDLGALAAAGGDLTAQYVDPRLMPSLSVEYAPNNGNPVTYKPSQRTIKIRPGQTSLSDTMHEIVHGIEDQFPNILKKTKDFLAKRSEGKPHELMSEMMKGFAHNSDAVGFRDKWWARGGDHYTGRFYADNSGNIIGTEVLTTGLQRLHTSPIEFFTSDPEFFDFVITTLRFP